MKKLYFLLLTAVVFTSAAWAQNKTWEGPATGGSWTSPANWSGNTVPAAADVVEFGVGISGTITNVPNMNLAGLVISNGANITLSKPTAGGTNTLSITNNGAANEFVISEGSTLTLGNEIDIRIINGNGGNQVRASIAGEFNVGDNDYNTNAANSITTVESTGLLRVGGSGSVTSTNANRLVFTADATYMHGRNGGAIPTASWNSLSTVMVIGVTNTAPSGMGQTFGNFVWENASQSGDEYIGSNGTTISGALVINGTGSGSLRMGQSFTASYFLMNGGRFEIASGIPFLGGVSPTLTVAGNTIVSGGILDLNSGFLVSGTLDLKGSLIHSGGTITETTLAGTASVVFSGTSVQEFSKTGSAAISETVDFTVSSGATLDLGTSVLDGSTGTFTLSSGAKIITSHPQGLRSTGANGAIQTSGRSYSSGADYEFRGASTGDFTTTGNQVRDLIINNSTTGEVVSNRTFLVNRVLALSDGYLTPATGTITVNTAGNATTENGAFVNGPLSKVSNSTTAFIFPVGKVDAGLRIAGFQRPNTSGGTTTFRAESIRATPDTAPLQDGITRVSSCEHWDIDRTAGNGTAYITLSWAANSNCTSATAYVTSLATLRVGHLRGGAWRSEGNFSTTGTNVAGTIRSANAVNTFSPFALASISEDENPLPVVFANVRAYEKNNGVQIDWSNLTEKDVDHYVVERSSNGTDFSAIAQQLPTSNQDDKADYSAFDASPKSGTNYYRIKAEETTGKIVYSKILSVNLGSTTQSLRLYPNPVTGNQVNISLSNVRSGQYDLRVVNVSGQDVLKQRINSQGSTMTQTIDLPTTIAPGVYNMIITGADYRETRTFIVH